MAKTPAAIHSATETVSSGTMPCSASAMIAGMASSSTMYIGRMLK